MCRWLSKHSGSIAEWSTTFTFIVAVAAIMMAYFQLKQSNDQTKWQNYNEMNVRYAALYESIPKDIAVGQLAFKELPMESRAWIRRYFDLYSEEYWLYKNGLIPDEMWTHQIHTGVRVNLHTYPALVDGYKY